VDELGSLTPRNAAWFKKRYNVDIHTRHEVTKIDPEQRTVTGKNLDTNETIEDSYDTLVLATEATPLTPTFPGVDQEHVFHVRTISHTVANDTYLRDKPPKKLIIVGSGFI